MKNNSGVSLMALVITIVIMIILSAVALRQGNEDYIKAQEAKEDAERNQVTIAVEYRYGNYLRNKTTNQLVGDEIPITFDVNNFDEVYIAATKAQIKQYLVELFQSEGRLSMDTTRQRFEREIGEFIETNINQMQYTRILRHGDIINLELDNISLKSVFLVNYATNSVVGPIN